MKWVIAKIGTMPSQRVLLLKGRLKVGALVVWSESGRRVDNHPQTGIIWKIDPPTPDFGGLVFIDRM